MVRCRHAVFSWPVSVARRKPSSANASAMEKRPLASEQGVVGTVAV
jgi:hypothetical protein